MPPELSVIISCFYEEQSIDEFYGRLRATLEATGRRFEVIIVNDGSTDGTLERLRAIHARDPDVTVVDLFRNSGQACAITAGIERATGANFVFMDSDLQLEPEELPSLLAAFDRGADVVSGVRRLRKDPLRRRLYSVLANWVMRRVARADLTDFGCTFKVFRGALIRAHEFGPRRPFNPVYVIRSAGRCCEVPVTHHPRRYGASGWTLSKLLRFNLENMLGLAVGAFQVVSGAAFVVACLTFARIALAWTFPGSILAGQPTTGLLLNAMLLATALIVALVALVGEYVVRLHGHQYAGPSYVVREVLAGWAGPRDPTAAAEGPGT